MCEPCRDDRRAAKRTRRAERRAASLCEDCAAPVTGGAAYCGPCAAARNERRQRDPEAAREADRRRYAERRARGDCTSCGKPTNGAAECQTCRDAARARYDARRAAGVCVRCRTPTAGGAACCAPCAAANVAQRDREPENAAKRQRHREAEPRAEAVEARETRQVAHLDRKRPRQATVAVEVKVAQGGQTTHLGRQRTPQVVAPQVQAGHAPRGVRGHAVPLANRRAAQPVRPVRPPNRPARSARRISGRATIPAESPTSAVSTGDGPPPAGPDRGDPDRSPASADARSPEGEPRLRELFKVGPLLAALP